jgi:hypothetical protein
MLCTESASAFDLSTHREILESAFGDGTKMSADSLRTITGTFWFGTGNLGSDLHQYAPERHFDNAPTAELLCQRWRDGVNTFLNQAVEKSEPAGKALDRMPGRTKALRSFGQATHALADFISHTNWIEEKGPDALPPLLGTTCDETELAGIQSGYFSLTSSIFRLHPGLDGCPSTGPPKEPLKYEYCHLTINKDSTDPKDSPEGARRFAGPSSDTYHYLATQLAITMTIRSYWALHDRIVKRWSQNQDTNAECVFKKLMFGGNESCLRSLVSQRSEPRIEGTWRVEDPGHGHVPVGTLVTIRLSGGEYRVTCPLSAVQCSPLSLYSSLFQGNSTRISQTVTPAFSQLRSVYTSAYSDALLSAAAGQITQTTTLTMSSGGQSLFLVANEYEFFVNQSTGRLDHVTNVPGYNQWVLQRVP